MLPEPVLIFLLALALIAIGFFFAWLHYGRLLKRIEKDTWAAAAHFYRAKSRE